MGTKAGIWQRVSTGGQDEASQRPDLLKWCAGHEYEVTRDYVVHAKSAYKGAHEADLRRAMEDMKAGEIDVLVVWQSSRIDRQEKLGALLREAQKYGGRIEFTNEPELNVISGLGGKVMTVVKEWANAEESRVKSERIKAKHESNRAAGSVNGRPPWGYRIQGEHGRKVLTPTTAGITYVEAIFDRVIAGESLRSVAAWLDAQGAETERGGQWHEGYLGRLIKNPVYYGKRTGEGSVSPVTRGLVSATKWKEAQAALASRVKYRLTAQAPALLSPVCGNPGCDATGQHLGPSPMYRVQVGSPGNRSEYYRCTGRGPQRKGCGNMVRLADLDDMVTNYMLADTSAHTERRFVPGDDRSDDIMRLQERGKEALHRGDYDDAMAAIAEARSLEEAPREAPHWITVETDQTEGEYFGNLYADAQREYLRRFVIAARTDDDGPYADLTDPIADRPIREVRSFEHNGQTYVIGNA